MLTDDDLTTELRAAFRDATGDLQYAGTVPTPRHRLAVVAPLAATAACVATLAVVWADAPATQSPAPAPEAAPSAPSTPPDAPRMVTDQIEVAGFSFTYRHLAGERAAEDLYWIGETTLPNGATPIDAPEGVKAWVGSDPESGDHGVWVEAPTRNGGSMFAVLSPTWSTEQLTDLFYNGARPVPAVER